MTSRSKVDFSDSEYFESGIVSRAQSPSQRSPLNDNDTELLDYLSSVPESDNFSEVSLESESMFSKDKIVTNTSSFNHELESTLVPSKNHTSLNHELLPAIGCIATTVYCWNCKSFVHSKLDFLRETMCTRIIKAIFDHFTFCDLPRWATKDLVHRCSYCQNILAKGIL